MPSRVLRAAHFADQLQAHAVVIFLFGTSHALFHQVIQLLSGLPARGKIGNIFLQHRQGDVRALDMQQGFDLPQHSLGLLVRPRHALRPLRLRARAQYAHILIQREKPRPLFSVHSHGFSYSSKGWFLPSYPSERKRRVSPRRCWKFSPFCQKYGHSTHFHLSFWIKVGRTPDK